MTEAELRKGTNTIRISILNIKRLTSLAGELQMNSSEMKTLDDAIDHLFAKANKKEKER